MCCLNRFCENKTRGKPNKIKGRNVYQQVFLLFATPAHLHCPYKDTLYLYCSNPEIIVCNASGINPKMEAAEMQNGIAKDWKLSPLTKWRTVTHYNSHYSFYLSNLWSSNFY